MRKTSERSGPRRWGWLLAGLAVATAAAGAAFAREALKARQIEREIKALKAEAESLRVRNFQIASIQASLESGDFLEREARLKLGLQKMGEQAVVLHKNVPAPAASAPDVSVPAEWSNAKKWWMYFADPRAFADYASSRHASPKPTAPHPSP